MGLTVLYSPDEVGEHDFDFDTGDGVDCQRNNYRVSDIVGSIFIHGGAFIFLPIHKL
jgi:hypothetical protein